MHRDFAYVARDKDTRILKCHVFRCDTPAKAIATSLHEICSKVRWVRAEEFNPLFFFSLLSKERGVEGRESARSGQALGEARRPPVLPAWFILFLMSAVALSGASPTKGAWPLSLPQSGGSNKSRSGQVPAAGGYHLLCVPLMAVGPEVNKTPGLLWGLLR